MQFASFKRTKGFTLVELLVVIVIIAMNTILVSTIVMASESDESAVHMTEMKNKGRAIWVAISCANMELEAFALPPVWPENLVTAEKYPIGESTREYFTYLMSEGGESRGTLSKNPEGQVVADLTPFSLIADGITPGKDKLEDKNIAWSVCRVGAKTPAAIPFLFSKNMTAKKLTGAPSSKATRLPLDPTMKPFGDTGAVWITRGGGAFSASHHYPTDYNVMGDTQNTITVWNCGK